MGLLTWLSTPAGNVYVVTFLNLLDKITPTGVISTISTALNSPYGVALDAAENIYVCDFNNRILKFSPAGVMTVFAGSGNVGSANGTGAAASFAFPYGLRVDPAGYVYVAEGDQLIRKISPAGVVTTLAGSPGTSGFVNGIGTAASFYEPYGIAFDASNNLYVTDQTGGDVRKIINTGYGVNPALPKA